MNKYNLAQILEAWEAAFGEDMMTEYPGFIQRLTEEQSEKKTIKIEVNAGCVTEVNGLPEGYDYEIIDNDIQEEKEKDEKN